MTLACKLLHSREAQIVSNYDISVYGQEFNRTVAMPSPERQLEEQLVEKLQGLKHEYRADIRDRATLEKNFREKFEALNRVRLTDGEFQRLLDESPP
jgi:hypothetical protein